MLATSNRISNNSNSILPFLAGAAFGMASSFLYVRYTNTARTTNKPSALKPPLILPRFAKEILSNSHVNAISNGDEDGDSTQSASGWSEVRLREWEDLKWRDLNGWQGRDLCHNPEGLGVRILHYYYNASRKEMVGVVWFGPHAESHRGLCHGGAMTSLMDDFCGHLAFLNSEGGPWSGATVQVNVSLKKPVQVGSTLRIIGKIHKHEGRKIFVHATLDNGDEDPVVYATLEGLSIDGVKMSQHEDPVSKRTWEVEVCERSGRLQRRDSGWKLQ